MRSEIRLAEAFPHKGERRDVTDLAAPGCPSQGGNLRACWSTRSNPPSRPGAAGNGGNQPLTPSIWSTPTSPRTSPSPATDRARFAALLRRGRRGAGPVLEGLHASASCGTRTFSTTDYPGFFCRLAWRREPCGPAVAAAIPRVHIWGALEARLQRVDMVVLGRLNEGTWPAQTRLDPLLARPMREALSLDPPERRIGLAAHDFAQALGQHEVWLTRADRQDGEPRVASGWLQRLDRLCRPEARRRRCARGAMDPARLRAKPRRARLPAINRSARALRRRSSSGQAGSRLRASKRLIRDPYAIYAR